MKLRKNAIIRRISLSACKISMILCFALSIILVGQTAVNAQTPSSYGKPLVVNGKLLYAPTATHTVGSSMSSNGIRRYFHYEPLGNKFAKVDYISQAPDKHQALRIVGSEYAMCIIRKNVQDGNKGNGTVRISGALKLSSSAPVPVKTVATEEKKAEEKKNEEAQKPDQLFPIIVLLQDKDGIIRLLAQTDETTLLEYQVTNLWELFILIPESCKKDFFELLKLYCPTAFTSEQNMTHRIYNAISKSAPFDVNNYQEYQRLIDDLSSDVYMKRMAATNRIKKEGVNFLAFARKLNQSQLDPEAQVRLADILSNEYYASDMDDIENMSVLFANSPYALIPLLESDNQSFNSIAQDRLKAKLGDSFQFDKSAPDDVRSAQIQDLKTRLNFPKPRTIQIDEQTKKRFQDLIDAIFDQNLSVFKF